MKPVYTISVSKVEAFHKWVARQTEDNEAFNNEESFLATLMGKFVQIDHAKYGECFHAIVEGTATHEIYRPNEPDPDGTWGGWKYKEVIIPDSQGRHAVDYRNAHPYMTKELPVSKLYHLRDCDLIITGRIDGLEGNVLRDTKTKYSNPDIMEDYIQSIQWKFYLDIMAMDTLMFDIFQVSGFKSIADCLTAKIKPWEPLPVKRYPTMTQDITEAMEDLMEYLRFKNLLEYVVIPQISPVAVQYGIYKDLKWSDSTTLNFGKHRGKTLAEVPQYLQWLYTNKALPAGLKEYMKLKNLIA